MGKTRVECAVCGSVYELTAKSIRKKDKGIIHCSICNNVIFEYDDYKIWYPFLITRKENPKH